MEPRTNVSVYHRRSVPIRRTTTRLISHNLISHILCYVKKGHEIMRKKIILVLLLAPLIVNAQTISDAINASPATCDTNCAISALIGVSSNNSSSDVPSGTICGMMTNGGGDGVLCLGVNPYFSCPSGYVQHNWNISGFGDGHFRWCSKI